MMHETTRIFKLLLKISVHTGLGVYWGSHDAVIAASAASRLWSKLLSCGCFSPASAVASCLRLYGRFMA